MHVCDIFNAKKVSEQRFNTGMYQLPGLALFSQVQITDVPQLCPVHLWPDCSTTVCQLALSSIKSISSEAINKN